MREKFDLVFVTPEMAQEMLNQSRPNRRVSTAHVRWLASQMTRGYWRPTHQGIAIDDEGYLIDGQHRLHAIILCGCGQFMWVAYGISKDISMAIDGGLHRRPYDFGGLTKDDTAILRTMTGISLIPRLREDFGGNESIIDLYAKFRDAIEFSRESLLRCGHIRGVTTATVHAVIARAWFTNDHSRLNEFCGVLVTLAVGDPTRDSAAITLGRYLTYRHSGQGGRVNRLDAWAKTERAVRAFLDGQPLTKLYAATEELFPIPFFGLSGPFGYRGLDEQNEEASSAS